MKKLITITATILIIALFSLTINADFVWLGEYSDGYTPTSYSVPEAAVTPLIDGSYSSTEWLGAYHTHVEASSTMDSASGFDALVSPSIDSLNNSIAKYDLYMLWVEGDSTANRIGSGDGGLYICVVADDTDPGGTVLKGGASNGPQDGIQLGLCFNFSGTQDTTTYIFDFAATSKTAVPCSYEHSTWKSECPFIEMGCDYDYQTGYTMEIFIPWISVNITDSETDAITLPDYGRDVTLKAGFVFKDGGGNKLWYEGKPENNILPFTRNVDSWNYYAHDFGSGADLGTSLSSPSYLDTITLTANAATADFSALKPLLHQISVLDGSGYTTESWDALYTAYTAAKALTAEASQSDVDAAISSITTLFAALEEKVQKEISDIAFVCPTKTLYKLGDAIDTTGISVTVNYSDETSEVVTDYAITEFDTSSLGAKIAVITYGDATENYVYTVYNLGDVDSNGAISTADARVVLIAALGSAEAITSDVAFAAADIDSNGAISTSDARTVLITALGGD